jgi:hypothetical protein
MATTGTPNVYVPPRHPCGHRKVRLLEDRFGTQFDKSWISEDALRALLRPFVSKPALRSVTPRRSTGGESSSAVGMR